MRFLILITIGPLIACASPAEQAAIDVRNPGPDFGDFVNSSDVVPRGQALVEIALDYRARELSSEHVYNVPVSIRFGISREVELQIGNAGIHRDLPGDATTGRSGLGLGVKLHARDTGERVLDPGVALQLAFALPTASAGLGSDSVEAAAGVNVTHPLVEDMAFTWNAVVSNPVDETGSQFLRGTFNWTLGYSFSRDLTGYATGTTSYPDHPGFWGYDVALGGGFGWYLGDRVALNLVYARGLSGGSPDHMAIAALALAF